MSHIISSLVGKHLKETSVTGYLRNVTNPNLRQQDLFKEPLLCGECEVRFSKWEGVFGSQLYPVLRSDDFTRLEYDSSLMKFAVSLSWRVLVSSRDSFVANYPRWEKKVSEALEKWRLFLLGEHSKPGTHHHLFVFTGFPNQLPPHVHNSFLQYAIRAVDGTPTVSNSSLGVFTKLTRVWFYSPIVPSAPEGWTNTRIFPGHGQVITPQVLGMRGFFDFLNDRSAAILARPISEKQAKLIEEALLKDPERTAASEWFEVESAQRNLRLPEDA